jgi:hypothetical protein
MATNNKDRWIGNEDERSDVCSAVTLCAPWSTGKAYSTGLHALCEYLSEAEIGKPKPNWELQGLLGLAAFVLGFLAGK